jgi:hypothetical protein
MNDKELIISEINICDIHKERIASVLQRVKPLFPLTPSKIRALSLEELGLLELMTNRFAKLQDAIGGKIFPLLLKILQEYRPEESFLDRLHKLERLNIIESIAMWNRFREVRNSIAHDYPETSEVTVAALNECESLCTDLIQFWDKLKQYIQSHTQLNS